MLTVERLRYLAHYDAETGVLSSLRARGRLKPGDALGSLKKGNGRGDGSGYLCTTIDGKKYYVHRLAWYYVTGMWPTYEIDHEDTVRTNNRWSNLRDLPRAVNAQNIRTARSDNKFSGLLGVSQAHQKEAKFCATIRLNGVRKHLGTFPSAEEAHQAYLSAKRKLHTGCTI